MGTKVSRKVLRRGQVRACFANLPACGVGLEACASLTSVGIRGAGNKTDYHDARAIAEAVQRPGMRWVAVKTPEQQDVQALHRLRAARVQERTALCNQVRGLLAEYGIVLARGVGTVRRHLPELPEAGLYGFSDLFRTLLREGAQQLREPDTHIDYYTRLLAANRDDWLSRWVLRLQATRATNKVTVALANKLARIGWAVVRTETRCRAA